VEQLSYQRRKASVVQEARSEADANPNAAAMGEGMHVLLNRDVTSCWRSPRATPAILPTRCL